MEVHYPEAVKIRLVQDNLNTHDGASLYETFRPEMRVGFWIRSSGITRPSTAVG